MSHREFNERQKIGGQPLIVQGETFQTFLLNAQKASPSALRHSKVGARPADSLSSPTRQGAPPSARTSPTARWWVGRVRVVMPCPRHPSRRCRRGPKRMCSSKSFW